LEQDPFFDRPALRGLSQCGACLDHPPAYESARAAIAYNANSRRLVLQFKHGDRTGLAGPFARWMAGAGRELLAEADLLIPVPLHRWRLFRRRYNQAALLARALSRLAGVAWAPTALRRIRRTQPQGTMGRQGRQRNVQGAFRVNDGIRLVGKRVVLIDDVLTTGATVEACVWVLKDAGARRVDVLTLARVVLA
jgi:ComF family protein